MLRKSFRSAIGFDGYNNSVTGNLSKTVDTGQDHHHVPIVMTYEDNAPPQAIQVRRLTPVECGRLQGFPDNYIQVQHRGKPATDGPCYKALGNSMAVPVMEWIAAKIEEFD